MTLFASLPLFWRRFLRLLFLSFSVFLLISHHPLAAQEQLVEKAPIIIDGRQIFEISNSGGFSAIERAARVSQLLQNAVETASGEIPVKIDPPDPDQEGDIPVIEIGEDQKYLLSVTSNDAPEGQLLRQAQDWATQIRNAIERAQYERSFEYLARTTVIAMGLLFIAIAVSWLLGLFWERWLEPLVAESEEEIVPDVDGQATLSTEIAAQIILNALRLTVWLFIVIRISRLYPQTRQFSRSLTNSFFTSLNAELIPLGENAYSVVDLLVLVGLFAGLIVLARSIRTILRSRILRFTGLSRAAQETVSVIFNYTFIFIGTLVVLQLWGLDISSLTVFAGVLGVGVGLGLQGIAKEFLSGLVLIFERPIQVGDFVDVGGLMGTVERISVRSTEIRTLDQVSIILPNSRFLESEVINWSHHSSISRLRIPVGVAYGSDTKAVRQTLIDSAKTHPDILSHPSPQVFFTEFADSSLNFNLLVWITEPRKQFQIKSDLYFKIESLLNERGIEIPFPQRDLHVRSGNLPLDLSPELVHSLAQLSRSLSVWLDQHNGKQ
jgi:potassium efflux system protein